jgi:hypothetical protein
MGSAGTKAGAWHMLGFNRIGLGSSYRTKTMGVQESRKNAADATAKRDEALCKLRGLVWIFQLKQRRCMFRSR